MKEFILKRLRANKDFLLSFIIPSIICLIQIYNIKADKIYLFDLITIISLIPIVFALCNFIYKHLPEKLQKFISLYTFASITLFASWITYMRSPIAGLAFDIFVIWLYQTLCVGPILKEG